MTNRKLSNGSRCSRRHRDASNGSSQDGFPAQFDNLSLGSEAPCIDQALAVYRGSSAAKHDPRSRRSYAHEPSAPSPGEAMQLCQVGMIGGHPLSTDESATFEAGESMNAAVDLSASMEVCAPESVPSRNPAKRDDRRPDNKEDMPRQDKKEKGCREVAENRGKAGASQRNDTKKGAYKATHEQIDHPAVFKEYPYPTALREDDLYDDEYLTQRLSGNRILRRGNIARANQHLSDSNLYQAHHFSEDYRTSPNDNQPLSEDCRSCLDGSHPLSEGYRSTADHAPSVEYRPSEDISYQYFEGSDAPVDAYLSPVKAYHGTMLDYHVPVLSLGHHPSSDSTYTQIGAYSIPEGHYAIEVSGMSEQKHLPLGYGTVEHANRDNRFDENQGATSYLEDNGASDEQRVVETGQEDWDMCDI